MFTNSIRLANMLVVVAALALCVAACTDPGIGTQRSDASYDAQPTSGSIFGLAHGG